MKITKYSEKPLDANKRKNLKPVVCYPIDNLKDSNLSLLLKARKHIKNINEIIIPPRDAKTFEVKVGQFFRVESIEGPQVGDLNLFQANNFDEKFYSGKTRALYGTHLSTGDKMLSNFPYLRSLATITWDTLDWYGYDRDGGSVHDVLNVFMCTGFTKDTKQYFIKSSPVRPGDYLEFFAETDLLGVLSTCPGGDCGSEHSSDNIKCHPLKVSIWSAAQYLLKDLTSSKISSYSRNHGLD